MQRKLAINAFLNTLKTVLGIVFPLITYPYISRVLGVENIGVYNFSASILSYFSLIAALGISTYGVREGTQYRNDKYAIEKFVSEIFTINVISTLIAYILLFGLLFGTPFIAKYRGPVLILSAEIFFATIGVSWVCNIYEDFLAIAVRTIAFQLLSLVLIFLLVRSSDDLIKYLIIILLSNSGANLFNFFYIRKKYCKFQLVTNSNWLRHLKPIMIIFSTSVAITIYVSADTTMLGFMMDDYHVGLYSTAVKIYTIIKNVLAAILMVMIPQFALFFSRGDENRISELYTRIFNVLTAIMLPICMGLFSLSHDIVLLVSGNQFIGAANALKLLSLAVSFSLYSYMYTQCILIPNKQEKVVFIATAVSALLNVILNLVLIPIWGINAAALTTVLAEMTTFIIAYYYSRKTVRLGNIKKNLISVMTGCISIIAICGSLSMVDNMIIRVVGSICGSILSYFIILQLLHNPVLNQMKQLILDRKNN